MCFAADTRHGVRGGIAVTDDFRDFEILSLSTPDNRNMVLFPQRIDGRFWGNAKLVLGREQVHWCNSKVGPGAPPVKTEQGWLTLFHAVDFDPGRLGWGWEGNWKKRYSVGVMLLDLERPETVIAMSPDPLMMPAQSYPYEMRGYRDQVIFPGGMIVEEDEEVKIYYGAADTVIALATARLEDLLNCCQPL